MIDAAGHLPQVVSARVWTEPVDVPQRVGAGCGQGGVAEQVFRERALAAGIDDVRSPAEGEGLPRESLAVSCPRIVERIPPPLAVNQAAEVTLTHGLGRHVETLGRGRPVFLRLVSEEPEGLVLSVVKLRQEYRAACADAEFIADELRRFVVKIGPAARQPDRIIAQRLERRSVKRVGAAFGRKNDAHRPAQLGGDRIRLYRELLDGVERRLCRWRPAPAAIRYHRAVDDPFLPIGRRAEYAPPLVSRQSGKKRSDIPPVDR